VRKKLCCRLRVRSWSHCARRDASRIKRLRYICGGEEGSEANGSGREDIVEGSVLITGGVDDPSNEPGAGAPFTIWSRFDMAQDGMRSLLRYHGGKRVTEELHFAKTPYARVYEAKSNLVSGSSSNVSVRRCWRWTVVVC
jgi:hypothetical protein